MLPGTNAQYFSASDWRKRATDRVVQALRGVSSERDLASRIVYDSHRSPSD